MTIAEAKSAARSHAFAARKAACTAERQSRLASALAAALAPHRPEPLAGYLPIGTEVDPRPVMAKHAAAAEVAVPVVLGPGRPLEFRKWTPETRLVEGPFKVLIPEDTGIVLPRVVIVPLLAFDDRGYRLGYGGGFYDRTLERLRADGRILAIGLAFDAQNAPALPAESTDQPLDAIVTETGLRRF